MWDPHLCKDIDALESVQRFATKICTKSWNTNYQYRLGKQEFTKDEKPALRKRVKFFVARGTSLYYVGGGKQLNFSLLCIDLLRSVYYVSEARLY